MAILLSREPHGYLLVTEPDGQRLLGPLFVALAEQAQQLCLERGLEDTVVMGFVDDYEVVLQCAWEEQRTKSGSESVATSMQSVGSLDLEQCDFKHLRGKNRGRMLVSWVTFMPPGSRSAALGNRILEWQKPLFPDVAGFFFGS